MRRLPPWLSGLLALLLVLTGLVVFTTLSDHLPPGSGLVAIFTVLVAVVLAARRVNARRLGGKNQLPLFRRAVASGEIPEDADRDRWRAALKDTERTARTTRWFFVFLGVLVVGVNIASAVSADESWGRTTLVALVAVPLAVLVFAVVPYWFQRRQLRRMARLRDRLTEGGPS